ncbi:MAG: hypothetical protein WCG93_02805 [Paludibacter sp.]
MKKIKLIAFVTALFIASAMQGQISVSLHLGTPPQWGPAGYSEARYYYLPDVEAYYDIQASRFIYLDGGTWVHRTYLPGRYRNYDLYNGYKVVMNDYRGQQPYRYYNQHRVKYSKGYRGHEQKNIGERPGRGNSHDGQRSYNEPNRNEGRGNSHEAQRSYNQPNRNEGKGNNNVVRGNDNRGNDNNGRGNDKGNDKGNGRGNDKGGDKGHGNDKDRR